MLTPQTTNDSEPQILSQVVCEMCKKAVTAPYAFGQNNINVLKHLAYVYYGYSKQFEVAVSLNHEEMTSFWLHKWPRTPKSEPST